MIIGGGKLNEENELLGAEAREGTSEQNEALDYMLKSGSVLTKSHGEAIHLITVIGQIEGHYLINDGSKTTKYEHLIPLLSSIEESDEVDAMLMLINTMGGDVEAGLAVGELVSSMTKPTASVVLGGGHSIGVVLAVSANRSFIVPSATMTIHPVRMTGVVVGTPQTYHYFERMQDRIVKFVTSHSTITEEKFREYLSRTDQIATDTGSVVDGIEAVSSGLIDEVGGLSDALRYLRQQIAAR